mmetsp:Transcript_3403/g.4644  ORF Transcript_3403/g.4644 Transcript_3403/m.4644 type:complete len:181 (-) Transcript_3403:2349-2891(-)
MPVFHNDGVRLSYHDVLDRTFCVWSADVHTEVSAGCRCYKRISSPTARSSLLAPFSIFLVSFLLLHRVICISQPTVVVKALAKNTHSQGKNPYSTGEARDLAKGNFIFVFRKAPEMRLDGRLLLGSAEVDCCVLVGDSPLAAASFAACGTVASVIVVSAAPTSLPCLFSMRLPPFIVPLL